MNVENMKKLIARLEQNDFKVGFNMGTWFEHNGLQILGIKDAQDIVETHRMRHIGGRYVYFSTL